MSILPVTLAVTAVLGVYTSGNMFETVEGTKNTKTNKSRPEQSPRRLLLVDSLAFPSVAVWAGISQAWASTRPRLRNIYPMCVRFYYG